MTSKKYIGLAILAITAAIFLSASANADILKTYVFDGAKVNDVSFTATVDVLACNADNVCAVPVDHENNAHEVVSSGLNAGLYLVKATKQGYNDKTQYVYLSGETSTTLYMIAKPSTGATDTPAQQTNWSMESYTGSGQTGSTGAGSGSGTGTTPGTTPGTGSGTGTQAPNLPAHYSDLSSDVDFEDTAKPGDEVAFTIDVENDEANFDIEDVELTLVISNIDDSDDLEVESSKFDLDEGDSKTITLKAVIPYDAEDDTYSVKLSWKYESDNGVKYGPFTKNLDDLEVERDDNSVLITGVTMSSATYEAGSTGTVEVKLANAGKEDESVRLKLLSTDLKIERTLNFALAEGKTTTQSVSFVVPASVSDGKYEFEITAYYDSGAKSTSKYEIFTIKTAKVLQTTAKPAQVGLEVASVDVQDTAADTDSQAESNSVLATVAIIVVVIVALVAVLLVEKLPRKNGVKKR